MPFSFPHYLAVSNLKFKPEILSSFSTVCYCFFLYIPQMNEIHHYLFFLFLFSYLPVHCPPIFFQFYSNGSKQQDLIFPGSTSLKICHHVCIHTSVIRHLGYFCILSSVLNTAHIELIFLWFSFVRLFFGHTW